MSTCDDYKLCKNATLCNDFSTTCIFNMGDNDFAILLNMKGNSKRIFYK